MTGECNAHGNHKRIEKYHDNYEREAHHPFDVMDHGVPSVVLVAGHEKYHVVRVHAVIVVRSVEISRLYVGAVGEKRNHRPHKQYQIVDDGEPMGERGRPGAALAEDTDGLAVGRYEIHPRDVHAPPDGFRTEDHDEPLETAENEIAQYRRLQYELRRVVGQIVHVDNAPSQTGHRARYHYYAEDVEHVSSADFPAIRINDVVEPGQFGRGQTHYEVTVVGPIFHFGY